MRPSDGIWHGAISKENKGIFDLWSRILLQWRELNAKYVRVMNKLVPQDKWDATWWYGERSNMSMLAASAWSLNMVALAEYPSTRIGVERSKAEGRPDLYIYDFKKDLQVSVEGKFCFVTDLKKTAFSNVHRKLGNAKMQCGTHQDEVEHLFGAVFVAPNFSTVPTPEDKRRFVKELCELQVGRRETMVSWVFPATANSLRDPANDRLYYPGVAILVEKCE